MAGTVVITVGALLIALLSGALVSPDHRRGHW